MAICTPMFPYIVCINTCVFSIVIIYSSRNKPFIYKKKMSAQNFNAFSFNNLKYFYLYVIQEIICSNVHDFFKLKNLLRLHLG